MEASLDLKGTVLQITTRYSAEYDYDVRLSESQTKNGGEDHIMYELVGGYAVEVFQYLKSLLNFEYVLRPDVGTYAFEHNFVNNNDSIDLYMASFSLLQRRITFLDPTFPIGQSRIVAFLDHNFESNFYSQNLFAVPFQFELWALLFVLCTLCAVVISIFNRLERRMTLGDITFHCVTLALLKSTHTKFHLNSTRLAIAVFSLTVLIVMSSYCGILTSISAVNHYKVKSIESLIQSNYRIMLDKFHTIKYMLEALKRLPNVQKLLHKAEKSNFIFKSFSASFCDVAESSSAYIIDEETGLYEISKQFGGFPCTWGKAHVFSLRYPWVMYMRQDAHFKNAINFGIVRLRERGILRRIRNTWIPQASQSCFSNGEISFKSVTLHKISNAFKGLSLMFFTCPVLFFLEKLVIFIFPTRNLH